MLSKRKINKIKLLNNKKNLRLDKFIEIGSLWKKWLLLKQKTHRKKI